VDALAAAAGLPPIDSISQWKYITSLAKGTPPVPPPRTLLPLGSANHFADDASGALIRGSDHIKLIYGPKICEDIWTSDLYLLQRTFSTQSFFVSEFGLLRSFLIN